MPTIAAISTPNAVGGIAVIRISGEDALAVGQRIFRSLGNKSVDSMAGYTCAYGDAMDGERKIDDCILTVFRAPHSYTGEDTVEISCHGGLFVSRQILRTALKNGAEPAGPGEFTKRAFLNGKLDLTQAEAVMDVISAKNDGELRMAEMLRDGAAFRTVKKCSDALLRILSGLAAWTDYPDEDIPEVEPKNLLRELRGVRNEMGRLVENYDSGRIVREGVSAAIVGRPNVGKSTLFNCLSGCQRSIVTEIAGTTRDVVEETVRLGDIVLRLSDTAGIHDTEDKIESMGIDIAMKTAASAELVIAVFDGSCPLTADDFRLIENLKGRKAIAVVNKSDVGNVIDVEVLQDDFIQIVYISAKENDGIEKLENAVKDIFTFNSDCFSSATVGNERQKLCIENAISSLDKAVEAIEAGELLDAVNILVDDAESKLMQLTGEKITDAVVDEVFSRFCVGK